MAKGQALYQDTASGEKQELQPELMSIMKEEVGKARERRIPIIRAFEEIARRSGLKSNTIRNYYYRYIHANKEAVRESTEDTAGSSLNSEDAIGRPFTAAETKALMREMLIAQARGESVRGCANRLGNGDKRMLIRFQNKYRSIIAREPEYVKNLIKEIEAEGIPCYNPYTRVRVSNAGRKPAAQVSEKSSGQLIDWVSQFVANMQSIKVASLDELIRGLRDLSSLAAGNQGLARQIERHHQEMQDLQNRILLMESSLEKERSERQKTDRKLSELMNINRSFIDLPDEEKLSGLKEYIARLQSCMQS
ncbi:MAG TPA: hypothetical protein GX505_13140 [Clostridiales bacterium]|nr:hypothetical protein [Clostridiales bacterium]